MRLPLLVTNRRGLAAVGALVAALALAPAALAERGKPLPPLAEAPRDALMRALERGTISEATYALERATSLFAHGAVARRYGPVERAHPREATLVLRDLALRLDRLGGAERTRAESLLARPTDGVSDPAGSGYTVGEETPVCGDFVCVHYVASTGDASTGAYASEALGVFDDVVWPTQVAMGYRAPKSDMTSPNDGANANDPDGSQFDVYLANLGDDGLYGYCTTDDPAASTSYDLSAYCVVDNDYAPAEFPSNTPTANLQVTAAHEFFHAVQFGYDAYEDAWLMEATATWMEEQLYDDVNDNLQYLGDGPLGSPGIPLDKETTDCCHVYGDWIFFAFLAEHFGADPATDPTAVRQIWNRADAAPGAVDDYSIQAVKNVLASRGTSFTTMFRMFGWVNRVSRRWYAEGAANAYPQAPLSASMTLKPGSATKSKSVAMNHQTSKYFGLKRGSGVKSGAKLRVTLDLPDKKTGSAASALVYSKSGAINPYSLAISRRGNGTFSLPFGSGVSKVELVLTDASIRYADCWSGYQSWSYACGGRPRDDGRKYKFTAKLG